MHSDDSPHHRANNARGTARGRTTNPPWPASPVGSIVALDLTAVGLNLNAKQSYYGPLTILGSRVLHTPHKRPRACAPLVLASRRGDSPDLIEDALTTPSNVDTRIELADLGRRDADALTRGPGAGELVAARHRGRRQREALTLCRCETMLGRMVSSTIDARAWSSSC